MDTVENVTQCCEYEILRKAYIAYEHMLKLYKTADRHCNYRSERNHLFYISVKEFANINFDINILNDIDKFLVETMRRNLELVAQGAGCPACYKRRMFHAACCFCDGHMNDTENPKTNPFEDAYFDIINQKRIEEEENEIEEKDTYVFGMLPEDNDESEQEDEEEEEETEKKNWLKKFINKNK